ncbi:MAG: phosphoenolpyruvate carboxykinase [Deltaproteobacteria bacterium]|nr:phosphoenolpyruvate carboxykinase [Deltaproteobacteria bacterium]
MKMISYKILSRKVILYTRWKICETTDELLSSRLFEDLLEQYCAGLTEKESYLLNIFDSGVADKAAISQLTKTLQHLAKLPADAVRKLVDGSESLFRDVALLSEFIEQLYNYWRGFDRFILCDSEGDTLDARPYRTFNLTIEKLTHLIRGAYRDIEENLTDTHPRIYRQITAGAEIAAISRLRTFSLPDYLGAKLDGISVIRQVLLNPPLILNPPMNKRTGQFIKVKENPLAEIDFENREWLCYPAKVGHLIILIYFHATFFELGFTLCNLFELADDEDLERKPDAIYAFGVPEGSLDHLSEFPTVFYENPVDDMLIAAVSRGDMFGYFGYLKKMVLTLHNIKIMRAGKLPFHGAFVKIIIGSGIEKNILIIGDTGAGKSETLEAFRAIGNRNLKGMFVIADDMGSIDIDQEGEILGYGTETGAFLRLDDLQPGYAFGQIDRSIIMNPSQTNARIVMPVTTLAMVNQGHKIDMILYANNYEQVDDDHPIIERLENVEQAFNTFREGTVMSKGTTTSTGIVHSYFANIFGPTQYKDTHDEIAKVFFKAFFSKEIFVGQIRTRLGIAGYEASGPESAAQKLLEYLNSPAA